MKELKQGFFTGERALFGEHDLRVVDSVFDAGESPLKECHDLELRGDLFRWKYLDDLAAAHFYDDSILEIYALKLLLLEKP